MQTGFMQCASTGPRGTKHSTYCMSSGRWAWMSTAERVFCINIVLNLLHYWFAIWLPVINKLLRIWKLLNRVWQTWSSLAVVKEWTLHNSHWLLNFRLHEQIKMLLDFSCFFRGHSMRYVMIQLFTEWIGWVKWAPVLPRRRQENCSPDACGCMANRGTGLGQINTQINKHLLPSSNLTQLLMLTVH